MDNKISLMKQKIKDLEEKITSFKTSQEFLDFVAAMSRFHTYSFNNQLLILSQRPDAAKVAGFVTWKKMGRYVKKGEKGIMILVPIKGVRKKDEEVDDSDTKEFTYFRTGHVFDISQTEGEPIPDIDLSVEDKGEAFYNSCLSLVTKHDIEVDISPDLTVFGVSKGGKIGLKEKDNKTEMATTMVHEIAHEWLHQDDEKHNLDRETKELEAETAAYIVCSHFGIDVPSHKYLATWQKNHEIMDSLKRISECSNRIIGELEVMA